MKCVEAQSLITEYINDELSGEKLEQFLTHIYELSLVNNSATTTIKISNKNNFIMNFVLLFTKSSLDCSKSSSNAS